MALKQRLDRLRGRAGAGPARAPGVAERLARYAPGRRPAAPRPSRPGADALAAALEGTLIAEDVILVRRRRPLDDPHGTAALTPLTAPLRGLPEAEPLDPGALVFVDTETTGLAGGSGTVAFMVGLARVVAGALEVRQYLLTRFAGEAAMLADLRAWLPDAAVLVSYNGKCFDLPLLAARYRLQRLADPCAGRPHLDLLHGVRRLFEGRWPDCRLASAEARLLGFVRADDLPGSEAPAAWLDWVRRGDPGRLGAVLRHNHWDLVSLAALLPRLAAAHAAPVAAGADPVRAARAWLSRGRAGRALAVLEAARSALDGEGLLALAGLHRRRGDWAAARAIWEPLAEAGSPAAAEALAKYHEHQRRDYARALDYARRLPPDPPHERRRARLAARLAPTGA